MLWICSGVSKTMQRGHMPLGTSAAIGRIQGGGHTVVYQGVDGILSKCALAKPLHVAVAFPAYRGHSLGGFLQFRICPTRVRPSASVCECVCVCRSGWRWPRDAYFHSLSWNEGWRIPEALKVVAKTRRAKPILQTLVSFTGPFGFHLIPLHALSNRE